MRSLRIIILFLSAERLHQQVTSCRGDWRTWFLKSTMTLVITSVSVGRMYSVPLAPFFSHVSNALCVLQRHATWHKCNTPLHKVIWKQAASRAHSGGNLNRPLRALDASTSPTLRYGTRLFTVYLTGLRLQGRIPRHRHRHRHPREDTREDVGVGVVECGLQRTTIAVRKHDHHGLLFSYSGSTAWNKLPRGIRVAATRDTLKLKLTRYCFNEGLSCQLL